MRKLNSIYDIFYENECGATTIDSVGLGKTLLTKDIEVPVFAGIRNLIEKDKPYNKTIISVIRSDEKLKRVSAAIREVLELEHCSNTGRGFMFVLPVDECIGYALDQSEVDPVCDK
jgi:nitrogen regulatory protein PII